MTAKKVVIIGAGIGGLATANLLAEAGYDVHVYEKERTAGGRAGKLVRKGFQFDTGPSWYLMPEVFEHYYGLLGESADAWLELEKLTPAYKVFFESSDPIIITGKQARDQQTFEKIEAGAGAALAEYVQKSDDIYQLSLKHFLYSNFEKVTDFMHQDILKKVGRLPYLLGISIDRYVSGFVKDMRLKQILEYPMVFLGTSPFSAPAMYSLMSALDFKEGVFFPKRGMYAIIESLVAIGKKRGVRYHFSSETMKIVSKQGKASGVVLKSGETVLADIVISNADLHHTETKLLKPADRTYPEEYWKKKQPGPGALLLYLGVKGSIPEFEHHNLLFVDAWKENFKAIYKTGSAPETASIYISLTSKTDQSVAPAGHETIFVLVPLPPNLKWSAKKTDEMVSHYLTQIKNMTGVDLESRLVVREVFGPSDFKTKYYSWQSSMLGQSHILKQSAFFRTPNISKKVKNLYYVGCNTTPGIGLPMCLIGAELVYKRLAGERKGGRVSEIQKIRDRL